MNSNRHYYNVHCKTIIYPIFISKYLYRNLEELPKLRSSQFSFAISKYKRKFIPLLHYFWSILFLHKKQTLWFFVHTERRKLTKKKLISYFSFRLGLAHVFYILEYLSFIGFGSIINNPFQLKKQAGLYGQIFLNKLYYLLYPALFFEKGYNEFFFLNQPINLQVYFFFKRTKKLLLLEKWNLLRLLNIPFIVK